MNGGHDTALNRSILVKSISHRSQAVGGAGSSGDNLVVCVKSLFVNAVNDGLKILTCRSGNNNLFSACVDMSLSLVLRGVEAGALKNYINTDFTPRKIRSVLFSINLYGLAVNSDAVFPCGNLVSQSIATLCGIVLEKVSEHSRACKIVYSNNLIAFCAEHLTESETAYTAETINSNFYHWKNLLNNLHFLF